MATSSCFLCGRCTRRDTDALALVRLGLAPATDFGRDLTDLLAVDAADLDGILVGNLDVDAFRDREVHVVAVAELQPEVPAPAPVRDSPRP